MSDFKNRVLFRFRNNSIKSNTNKLLYETLIICVAFFIEYEIFTSSVTSFDYLIIDFIFYLFLLVIDLLLISMLIVCLLEIYSRFKIYIGWD